MLLDPDDHQEEPNTKGKIPPEMWDSLHTQVSTVLSMSEQVSYYSFKMEFEKASPEQKMYLACFNLFNYFATRKALCEIQKQQILSDITFMGTAVDPSDSGQPEP